MTSFCQSLYGTIKTTSSLHYRVIDCKAWSASLPRAAEKEKYYSEAFKTKLLMTPEPKVLNLRMPVRKLNKLLITNSLYKTSASTIRHPKGSNRDRTGGTYPTIVSRRKPTWFNTWSDPVAYQWWSQSLYKLQRLYVSYQDIRPVQVLCTPLTRNPRILYARARQTHLDKIMTPYLKFKTTFTNSWKRTLLTNR